MSLRILSFFIEGVTWRVAQTSEGFFHWGPAEVPEWKAGIPAGIDKEIVESTFRQFSSDDDSLQPQCFVFSSPEGDLFSVSIPPATFAALQETFSSQSLPRMRIARIAVEQALSAGLPELELLPAGSIYESVQTKLKAFLPRTR